MIVCGWCGRPTPGEGRCSACRHPSPRIPWEQRGEDAPAAPSDESARLAAARARLGAHATAEALAEALDVSPRTVRRWQQMAG